MMGMLLLGRLGLSGSGGIAPVACFAAGAFFAGAGIAAAFATSAHLAGANLAAVARASTRGTANGHRQSQRHAGE